VLVVPDKDDPGLLAGILDDLLDVDGLRDITAAMAHIDACSRHGRPSPRRGIPPLRLVFDLRNRGLLSLQRRPNGEFRADHLAEPTMDASLRLGHPRRMVALGVELDGDLQDLARAVFHAEAASLAAFRDDMDLAPGDPEFFQVIRNALNRYALRPSKSTVRFEIYIENDFHLH